jgi:hypothetical protein
MMRAVVGWVWAVCLSFSLGCSISANHVADNVSADTSSDAGVPDAAKPHLTGTMFFDGAAWGRTLETETFEDGTTSDLTAPLPSDNECEWQSATYTIDFYIDAAGQQHARFGELDGVLHYDPDPFEAYPYGRYGDAWVGTLGKGDHTATIDLVPQGESSFLWLTISDHSRTVNSHDHVDAPNGGYDITVTIDKTEVTTFDNGRLPGPSRCDW